MNMASLLWGLLFGSIGLGYFIYGKKQRSGIPLMAGIGLMIFPYFISNSYLLVVVGIALMALPYLLQNWL